MSTTTPPPAVEVVGVCAPWWARETRQPVDRVIADAARFADGRQDPYELARYLSSGNDTGASSYSTDTGGGTMVRDAATGRILAIYVDGAPATLAHQPFSSRAVTVGTSRYLTVSETAYVHDGEQHPRYDLAEVAGAIPAQER